MGRDTLALGRAIEADQARYANSVGLAKDHRWHLDIIERLSKAELDALDVKTGKRRADHFHFIPRPMAQQSKPVFPKKYRK